MAQLYLEQKIDGPPLSNEQMADVHDQEGGKKKKGKSLSNQILRRVCFSPLWVDVAFDD
jgi:hypothetical protein